MIWLRLSLILILRLLALGARLERNKMRPSLLMGAGCAEARLV